MTGLTATALQEELCREIEKIFEHDYFKNTLGEPVSLNVYEQFLPIRQSEDDPDPAPYIIVRLLDGNTQSDNDPQVVNVLLLFAIFSDDLANNGHLTVLGMIQKVQERFQKEPMLANAFMFKHPFEWALQDEESYPYYIGAAYMQFETAAIRKEDKFA